LTASHSKREDRPRWTDFYVCGNQEQQFWGCRCLRWWLISRRWVTGMRQTSAATVVLPDSAGVWPCLLWDMKRYSPVVTIRTTGFYCTEVPHTVFLCVLCGSQNKQPLFPYTPLT